jgi:hypothetical protein
MDKLLLGLQSKKVYDEMLDKLASPFIKAKDPSKPIGNNFTPKKKKRK